MSKDKAVFFGIIGVVATLLVVYIIVMFGGKSEEQYQEESFRPPDMEIEDQKHEYNSRIAALTENRYEKSEKENPLRYNFIEDSEQDQESTQEEELEPIDTERKVKNNRQQSISHPKAKSQTPKQAKKSNVKKDDKKEAESEEEILSITYDFSTNAPSENESNDTKLSKHRNIWAQLREKSTIHHNSNQVFLLESGTYIGGRYFPGNSKLYSMAVVKKDFMDIIVHRIKDSNTGEEFSVSMYAINEDRTRGIKLQSRTNREGDNAKNNVLSETMKSVYRRYDVDNIAEAAGEGFEEIAERQDAEIPLGQGYRLIFIED